MEEIQESKKKHFFKKYLIILFLIIILIYSYMHYIEPKLVIVKDFNLTSNAIPSSFKGFTITHFSDIHFGRTTNEKELEKVVTKINETKPDLVLFSGDLFDTYITLSENNIAFLKKTLKNISASLNKFAVIGDYDADKVDLYKEIMNEAGFTILDGERKTIFYQGNTPIYINGISSISRFTPDYEKLMQEKKEGLQLFLSHEPEVITKISDKVDYLFSGHSLGGLVRLPGIGGLINNTHTKEFQKGEYKYHNSVVFVNNGIGTQNFSVRLFNIPSIYCYRII